MYPLYIMISTYVNVGYSVLRFLRGEEQERGLSVVVPAAGWLVLDGRPSTSLMNK